MSKGEKNSVCNVLFCLNEPAIHFNHWMNAYYCTSCARKINDACRQHGDELLCDWPAQDKLNDEGKLAE
jgi:hypothetical protein